MYISCSNEWVNILDEGLRYIKTHYVEKTHILLVIEDLIPLRHLDSSVILSGYRDMIDRSFKKLSFFINGIGTEPLSKIGGDDYFIIPEDFIWYNSLQPSLWSIDYLSRIVTEALGANIKDPWRFEHMKSSDSHCVSRHAWPSVFQGLHYMKNINLDAVKFIQVKKIRRRFYLEYLRRLPSQYWWRLSIKVKRIFKN